MKDYKKYYCPKCFTFLKLRGVLNDVGFIYYCPTITCDYIYHEKSFKPYEPPEMEFAREYECTWVGGEKNG